MGLMLVVLIHTGGSLGLSQLHSYRTRDLRLLYYSNEHRYILQHMVRSFENSLRFHHRLFDYTPSEEVTIFLHDWHDFGTGGTNTIPWNFISIGIEPYDYTYETSPANERMNWVMNHELAHLVATDKASSSDRFFRSILGGKVIPLAIHPVSMFYSYLTTPRWYCPRWYHEGIATFLETWMAGGIGRALGGYDEMVFRSMVQDSSYFYDFVGLESEGTTIDFQIGANSYLYGTRFVSYLADQYGPEKVLAWFNRTDSSDRYFASQFERVYGRDLDDEWSRWVVFEHQWQRGNLDSIRAFPVTQGRAVFPEALGSVSRAFVDSAGGRLFLGVNFPGELASISGIHLRSGEMQTLCNVPTPALYYVTSLAFDASSGTLFYTQDNSRNWRDIYKVDISSGEQTLLFKDCRIGDLVVNPADKSLWGVQHLNGFSTLIRMPAPYKERYEILPLLYGKDMYDLDISPDGRRLSSSLIEISGRQTLIEFQIDSLMQGNLSYTTIYEFENNAPSNFVYSNDGNHMFGTSYYTGVSNVFRYDFATKKMEALTNSETGFFRPLHYRDDSLIVFRYTGKGFVPMIVAIEPTEDIKAIRYLGQDIVEKFPVVTTWKLAPPNPSLINTDSLILSKGEYSALGNIAFAGIYPIVEGYKDFFAFGLCANLTDPFGAQLATVSASYTPNIRLPEDERFHASLSYDYWEWKILATYNGADFYDLFGPTKTSRKGYSLGVTYANQLISERPRVLDYSLSVAGYGGLETLPEFQNVATSFDKFMTMGGRVTYSYMQRTLGAVDFERGIKTGIVSSNTLVRSTLYPKLYAKLDLGVLLPLEHSSLWLRTAAGQSFGVAGSSFSNFYFGGFGNNWVDHQEFRRYREYYSFPGVELNEIGGHNFGKAMVEWTLPPLRFRRFGIPSLYSNWAQLVLFSSGLATDIGDDADRLLYANLGGQLDVKLVIFSNLESTLSFGCAWAAEQHQRRSRELMFSLKILR